MIDQAHNYNQQANDFAEKAPALTTWKYIGQRGFDDLLDIKGTESILDLGSASGRVEEYLMLRGADPALITGVEISDKEVELAKEKYPGIDFRVGDIRQPVGDQKYDFVISHMVFEHLDNEGLEATFKNAHASLKSDGEFVFVVTHPDKIAASDGITERGWFTTSAPWGGEVQNFQRPVEDYFEIAKKTGFEVRKILDLKIPDEAKDEPDYEKYKRYGNVRLGMSLSKIIEEI